MHLSRCKIDFWDLWAGGADLRLFMWFYVTVNLDVVSGGWHITVDNYAFQSHGYFSPRITKVFCS